MAGETLTFAVSWPKEDRTVKVEVKFRRALPPAILRKAFGYGGEQRDIYAEHVETKETMIAFLTKVTRSVDDGGKVKAPCPVTLKDKLYEVMKITPSTPRPIEVEAADG